MKKIFILTFILFLIFESPEALCGERVYKIAFLPTILPIEIFSRFSPLVEYLSRRTGEEMNLVIPSNFEDHISMVKKGDVDFAYQDPIVYLMVSKEAKVVAMTLLRGGEDQTRGIIIIKKDSGIKTIRDLLGKRVSIISKMSADGYYSQKFFLSENGIDVDKDLRLFIAQGNKAENVIFDVFEGRADAGFIGELDLHRVNQAIDSKQISLLTYTTRLPSWAFSAHWKVKKTLVEIVKKSLLELKENDPVLRAAQIKRFIFTTDETYNNLRIKVKGELFP